MWNLNWSLFTGQGVGEILTLWVKGVCNVLGLFWGFAVLFWEGKGLVFLGHFRIDRVMAKL